MRLGRARTVDSHEFALKNYDQIFGRNAATMTDTLMRPSPVGSSLIPFERSISRPLKQPMLSRPLKQPMLSTPLKQPMLSTPINPTLSRSSMSSKLPRFMSQTQLRSPSSNIHGVDFSEYHSAFRRVGQDPMVGEPRRFAKASYNLVAKQPSLVPRGQYTQSISHELTRPSWRIEAPFSSPQLLRPTPASIHSRPTPPPIPSHYIQQRPIQSPLLDTSGGTKWLGNSAPKPLAPPSLIGELKNTFSQIKEMYKPHYLYGETMTKGGPLKKKLGGIRQAATSFYNDTKNIPGQFT